MKSRIRTSKKSTREQTPEFSTAPAQPMFQSRPFVVQTRSAQKSQQPDLKTSLRRAQRYGHHLGHIASIEPPAPTQAHRIVQAKPASGQPGERYEKEAARTAALVVNQMHPPASLSSSQKQKLQREQTLPDNEELQTKPAAADTIQRVERSEAPGEDINYYADIESIYDLYHHQEQGPQEQTAPAERENENNLRAEKPLPEKPLPDLPQKKGTGKKQAADEKLRQQRAEREQELQGLRGNKQPEPYKGTGIGKDARLMVEDPRFKAGYGVQRGYGYQPGYKLERESDPKGFGRRIGLKTFKAGKNYLTKHTEELKADPVRYGAELLTNKLPITGTGKHIASAVHEGKRQKINKSVAKNDNADELTQSIATGLAKNHKREQIMQGIGAGLSGASGVATAVTGGASLAGDHAIKSAITRTIPHVPALIGEINLVGKGATGINLAATAGGKTQELITSKDRQTRLASRLPQQEANTTNPADAQAHKNKVDEANKTLISLGKEDPDFGRTMLAHLSQPAQKPEQERKSVFSELNSKKGEADTTSGVVKENTLKPSDVARLTAPEKARLRQRERMKVTDNQGQELNLLEILRKNEKKKWYENK